MRATIEAADLSAALKSSVAPGNSPHAMLMHARFQTCTDGVVVETTDTEVYMRTTIPAQVDVHGTALLRESLLRPVAAVGGQIQLASDGKLKRGRSVFSVPSMIEDGWPAQEESTWKPLHVDAAQLAIAIASVSHAATDEGLSPSLKGVHLTEGSVWASDTVSVSFVRIDYTGPSVTIPGARVRQVLAALGEGATLQVAHVVDGIAGGLRITRDGTQFSLRLLAHKPFDIRRVLQSINYTQQPLTVRRDLMLAALKRFMPFAQVLGATSSKAAPTVVLECDGGDLTLADRREESRELVADAVTAPGPKFRVAVDPRRLIAALSAVDSSSVALHPPVTDKKPNAFCVYATNADPRNEAHYVAPYTI